MPSEPAAAEAVSVCGERCRSLVSFPVNTFCNNQSVCKNQSVSSERASERRRAIYHGGEWPGPCLSSSTVAKKREREINSVLPYYGVLEATVVTERNGQREGVRAS